MPEKATKKSLSKNYLFFLKKFDVTAQLDVHSNSRNSCSSFSVFPHDCSHIETLSSGYQYKKPPKNFRKKASVWNREVGVIKEEELHNEGILSNYTFLWESSDALERAFLGQGPCPYYLGTLLIFCA